MLLSFLLSLLSVSLCYGKSRSQAKALLSFHGMKTYFLSPLYSLIVGFPLLNATYISYIYLEVVALFAMIAFKI